MRKTCLRNTRCLAVALFGVAALWLGRAAEAQCVTGNPLMLCPLSVCLTLQADVTLQCKTPPPTSCAGIVGCSALQAMKTRWLACGAARSRINVTCFGGGDLGHQTALAQVYTNVGTCEARIALPRPTGCTDPCPVTRVGELDFLEYLELVEGTVVAWSPAPGSDVAAVPQPGEPQ